MRRSGQHPAVVATPPGVFLVGGGADNVHDSATLASFREAVRAHAASRDEAPLLALVLAEDTDAVQPYRRDHLRAVALPEAAVRDVFVRSDKPVAAEDLSSIHGLVL